MEKIAVLIPCYNEELTIEKVVKDFRRELPEAEIYVYDNNSKDKTAEIARKAGAIVRKEYRQGKGNVVRTMFREIDADIYVNAHATSPFAKVETIDACIEKGASGEYDSAFCAENIKTFMWTNGKPINFNPDCFPRTQDLPDFYGETSIAYVFTKDSFIKNNRRLGIKPYIHEVGKIEAMDIDYPEDFDIANAVYKEIICK